ncbi:MAG TPA: UbiA family prenyltransferase [Ideonella sp.]|uniref:UbiA family prenyltransferase n=1 Tax=Ideonella sp. TaxID=1929293 RepID=UPI002E32D62C|nr:UbiA family prenyltransferase [Ideonella sp.]HEX5685033.1 UbiA family prenyltransferase [Ideonella sp.]
MVLLTLPELEPGRDAAPEAQADPVPLVVDLDGTLLHTDTLVESLFDVARRRPLQLLQLPAWLAAGRANLKRQLAHRASLDVSALPRAEDLLAHLWTLKRQGRRLVLATAADARIAQAIADQLGLFDAVLASDGRVNLSGSVKRDRLVATFGEGGFDYAGNSSSDLPVWAAARHAVLVRPSPQLAAATARVAEIEHSFGADRPGWREYLGAMRAQHWLKNMLLLVPLLATQQLYDLPKLLAVLVGFVCFSLAASGVYLLNDLFDLPADRRHPHKRQRALASGRLPLLHGLLLVPALWLAASLLALTLPAPFLAALGCYAVLNLAYSMRLRNYPIVDALVLAVGYSLRVYAGSLVVAIDVSPWLLVCSTALFFGLALLKRYAEIVSLRPGLGSGGRVRGYAVSDAPLIAGLGTAADCIAVVLLALYPVVITPTAPRLTIWSLSALLLFWVGHMWLMAHRGRIHDDLVAFALRDPLSRAFGVTMALLLLFGP